MKEVVIVSACRTAIGAFGGTLKDSNGAAIAAVTMKEAVKRAGIEPGIIDDVRYGCCLEHHRRLGCKPNHHACHRDRATNQRRGEGGLHAET